MENAGADKTQTGLAISKLKDFSDWASESFAPDVKNQINLT